MPPLPPAKPKKPRKPRPKKKPAAKKPVKSRAKKKTPRTWHKTKATLLATSLMSSVMSWPMFFWMNSGTKKWDFQARLASDPPAAVVTPEQQADGILSQTMYPPEPRQATPLDVLRRADNLTRSPQAPADRLRIAGVLHQANALIRQTRIRSIDELNRFFSTQFPTVLGPNYANWSPFLNKMDELASGLNRENQFKDMTDVARFFDGVESLMRTGQ
jgi:hypothetical protein